MTYSIKCGILLFNINHISPDFERTSPEPTHPRGSLRRSIALPFAGFLLAACAQVVVAPNGPSDERFIEPTPVVTPEKEIKKEIPQNPLKASLRRSDPHEYGGSGTYIGPHWELIIDGTAIETAGGWQRKENEGLWIVVTDMTDDNQWQRVITGYTDGPWNVRASFHDLVGNIRGGEAGQLPQLQINGDRVYRVDVMQGSYTNGLPSLTGMIASAVAVVE